MGAFRPFRLVRYLEKSGIHCRVITTWPPAETALDFHHLTELSRQTRIHYLYKNLKFVGGADPKALFAAERSTNHKAIRSYRPMNRLREGMQELSQRWIKPDADLKHAPAYIIKAMQLIPESRPQVILTTSPPHSIHAAGLVLARWWSLPWMVDFRDPWDDFVQSGQPGLANPFEHRLKHRIVNAASAVISTTRTYSQNLINERYTRDTGKFHTVTNCFDAQLARGPARKDPERFIISYVGIFYPHKDPYTFFRALRTWLDRLRRDKRETVERKMRVQLIGSSEPSTRKMVAALGLGDVVKFFGRLPHREAIRRLRQSDMALLSTGFGNQTRPGWLPSKLFEYLGCRIPILAITLDGEAAEIIRQTDSGYVVTTENHANIGRILGTEFDRKFGDNYHNGKQFSFAGANQYEESRVMAKMTDIIRSVAGEQVPVRIKDSHSAG